MSTSHHDHGHMDPPRVQEVADGAYAYIQPDGTWWINNTGFLVGPEGVVAIDGCATENRTRAFIDTVAKYSDAPIRTLINTHHHGDHTNGNYLFDTATIVAHERTRAEILAYGLMDVEPIWPGVGWGDLRPVAPFLTYTDGVTVYAGDLRAQVRHFGAAHTSNDSVVWLEEQGVLYTGDLIFNGGTPFLLMGSPAGYLEVLEKIKGLGATTLVPGHGEVCGPEQIDYAIGYTNFLLETARKGREAGLDPLSVARETDLGEYAALSDSERIVGNLHRAYAELGGVERAGTIDIYGALGDMVTFNDGKPLSCYA
ncbi:MBL fold metallo-hydrolase [Streptomyces sp. SID3343]|uniref:MBL fold metallo-hydrolase n=1 Tax=Streptomyces sp. SID3343 TaxID=2690260 RepID=UPI0013692183|nr:MBL fold metallo-hydrolase [Streptomyces sp. SID3343]MYW02573.1 MBL fold metallo-hydrolase [Streptomyces sp. SID3343]